MSELIIPLGQMAMVALAAVTGWTLLEMLGRGRTVFSLNRVASTAFWSAYFLVATTVVVLTVRLAMLA